MIIREFEKEDLSEMISVWNEIVNEGNAFPREEFLTLNRYDCVKIIPFLRPSTFFRVYQL